MDINCDDHETLLPLLAPPMLVRNADTDITKTCAGGAMQRSLALQLMHSNVGSQSKRRSSR